MLRSSLLLSSLLLLGACSSSERDTAQRTLPERRLLILGWDGATFDLIDPLLEAQQLPHLSRLLARGSSAYLESTVIPISSSAWVAAATGKGPGETGVYSFFEPVEQSYDVRLVSSRSNRATPIWRMLSARGLGVNVFGVPITFPPEPVEGTLVAGMLSPFDADYAWPPGTADALRERGFEPDLGIWQQTHGVTPARLWGQLDLKEDVVLELLRKNDWAFSMVVFKSLDVVSHGVYSTDTSGPVAQVLTRLDAALGQILNTVGEDTNVILMSDHGFRTYPRAFNLHAWLAEAGFATLSAETPQPGSGSTPLSEQRVLDHTSRMASLDLPRTRVLAGACEGNFGSLLVHLEGREALGTVAPKDLERTLDEVAAALKELRFGDDSTPLVTRVWRGTELYPGGRDGERRVVPDLLFETREDVHVNSSLDKPTFHTYGADRPQGAFPDHARDGILVMAGPDVVQSSERARASVLDITPTALYLLSQPVYTEMQGRVVEALLDVERPVVRIAEADDPWRAEPRGADGAYTAEDLEAVQQRLESIGYTD